MKFSLPFLLLCLSYCASAQIWTLKKGDYSALLSFSTSTFSSAYDSTGAKRSLDPVKIQNFTAQLKLVYGITDKFTVSLRLPYSAQSSVLNDSAAEIAEVDEITELKLGQLSYTGNCEAGILYRLHESRPFVSASLFVETNTNDHNFITGLSSGYDAWSFKPGFGLGDSYSKFWYMAYAAADIKTNNFSSGIVNSLEVGYKPVKEFFLAVNYTGRSSFNNGDYCNCALNPTGLFFNDQSYAAISIKPGLVFNGLGVNFGYTTVVAGRNIQGGSVFTAGFSYTHD